MTNVRPLVEEALDRIVAGEATDRVLERTLRSHRSLSSEERRDVARRLLGIALWRGRFECLMSGGRALWYPLYLVEQEGMTTGDAAAATGCDHDELVAVLATPEPPDPVLALAQRRSLPEWLAGRWVNQFGTPGADALAAATNRPGPVCLRANVARVTRDQLIERLAAEGILTRPSVHAAAGLVVEGRANLFGSQAWRAGLFELQDEASQLVVEACAAGPGMLAVDLCAGSGGKTLGLAATMRGEGRIVAADLSPARLRDQQVRLDRAGISCVEQRCGDGREPSLTRDLEGLADVVLVDAPCSETGVLRRSPGARWTMSVDAPDSFVVLQRALLERGAALVRPGGRLVYATCSVDRSENEEVSGPSIAGFRPEFSRTLRPDVEGTDGFHVAAWRRCLLPATNARNAH
jgi:16S rRNA (cytosine967-C5)-methyltransferase